MNAALPDTRRQGLGIVLMLCSALSLSVMNALVKALTQVGYPTLQIVLVDAICGFAAVLCWMLVTGRIVWVQRVRPLLALYILAALTSCFSLFYAFGHGQLAQISSVVAAAPLLVALLSFLFLAERLTRWQVGLAFAGFAGILLVLRPGADMEGSFPLLVALGGTLALACSQVLVRKMSRSIHTATFILYFYMAAAAVSGMILLGSGLWRPVATGDLPLFIACAAADVLALIFMYSAFRYAEASTVMPFQYSNIVWSALIGYVIWQEQLDMWTVAGAAVIISAGILFTRAALLRKWNAPAQT